MRTKTKICKCYVASLDTVTRYPLRLGAHERQCPIYRPSRDQLDQTEDVMNRQHLLAIIYPGDYVCLPCEKLTV